MHTINLPYKQGYVTPVPAAVVVNTYEFREAEDPSIIIISIEQWFMIVKTKFATRLNIIIKSALYLIF